MMDAVKACESGPCVKVMSTWAILNYHILPHSELHSWLTSLHFHTHVHPQAVSSIMVCSQFINFLFIYVFFLHYKIVFSCSSVMTDDGICILVF